MQLVNKPSPFSTKSPIRQSFSDNNKNWLQICEARWNQVAGGRRTVSGSGSKQDENSWSNRDELHHLDSRKTLVRMSWTIRSSSLVMLLGCLPGEPPYLASPLGRTGAHRQNGSPAVPKQRSQLLVHHRLTILSHHPGNSHSNWHFVFPLMWLGAWHTPATFGRLAILADDEPQQRFFFNVALFAIKRNVFNFADQKMERHVDRCRQKSAEKSWMTGLENRADCFPALRIDNDNSVRLGHKLKSDISYQVLHSVKASATLRPHFVISLPAVVQS